MNKFFYWFLGVMVILSLALIQYQSYQIKQWNKNYNKLVQEYNNLVDSKK